MSAHFSGSKFKKLLPGIIHIPITLVASVDLLKQCSCDKVAGQMEILEEERSLPDGEGEEWSVKQSFSPEPFG